MWQGRAKDDAYYIVLTSGKSSEVAESSLAGAARLLRLSVGDLNRIVGVGQQMPLARAGTLEEADLIREKLRGLGIQTITVPKQELQLDAAAKRVRALEFTAGSLAAIPAGAGGKISAQWEEVTLIVAGRLFLNRVEVEENNRGGRQQPVDKRELSSDESVVDIYTIDKVNWRIIASSFDFSCLGAAKTLTTFENFSALVNLLREHAIKARYDDSYMQARQALAAVWHSEQQVRKDEGRRGGARKFDVATVTTTNNEPQFSRYSRLRHYLKRREFLEDK